MLSQELLPEVKQYVNKEKFKDSLGINTSINIEVSFLAQGEYNINYILQVKDKQYVFRINTGSQMELNNQIAYEFQALKLLEISQVTPKALYLDASLEEIPYGLLLMEYLPGQPLDYRTDLQGAANTFARIHGLEFTEEETKFLVKEPGPFTGVYNEAVRLLNKYFECPQASNEVVRLLEKIIMKAAEKKKEEEYLLKEPWLRIINTEVNSHNFIVNHAQDTCYLVDWEKPIYGEPAQDLSHFLIATTTMWKRNYTLSKEEENFFLDIYAKKLPPCAQKNTLKDRVELFKFFNYLRAVSWCAMAWTEYIQPGRLISNQDTFTKIKAYIEPEFLKTSFPEVF